MSSIHRGAFARLVAGGVAAATAAAGFTVALALPASAAPVAVTGILTDSAGNGLDGFVEATPIGADGFSSGPSTFSVVADGQVALNVEPGAYKLFFSDESSTYVGEYYNDKVDFATADVVQVAGPTALAPVSLATRPLLTGKVVDAKGVPVKDASVTVYDAATNARLRTVFTRADGAWVAGVAAGTTYKVEFAGNGYASEFYNNKATLASADPVAPGSDLGVTALSRGSIVSGVVTGVGGVPLERVRVRVYTGQNSGSVSDLTDATGTYRVEGVAPGTVRVEFSDPVGEYLTEWNADKTSFGTADPVDVPVENVVTVNAALAPDPEAAINPADIDVSGIVVDSSGAPVIGAEVDAFDTPADADDPRSVETAVTGRTGRFNFVNLSKTSEAEFKLRAADFLEREDGQYERLTRWAGDGQNYAAASVVTKPAAEVAITLPLTGGISGTVTSASNLRVDNVSAEFFDEKSSSVGSGFASVEDDGTFETTSLVPGTYRVHFTDFSSGGSFNSVPDRFHAPQWYDDTTFEKAKKIVVKSGQTVTGINATLSADLKAFRKPEITGKPYLGGTLRANPGAWSVESGTTYSYEWLIGSTVVGTGPTYKVTSAAKNKRVTLRVRADNGSLTGTALASTQVIKKKPKVKVSVKGTKAQVSVSAKKVKAKKFKGTVVARLVVGEDEFGAPVYKKIGKAKLRGGKASLTLKKLGKGKNKVVFEITLKGGKYGNATVTKTVKRKKG